MEVIFDTETLQYDLDHNGTYEFTRVLDRSRDSLNRDSGFQLKDGATIENQATYGYSATDGRILNVIGGGDVSSPQTFSYGYTPNSNLLQTVTGPIHTVTNAWEATRDVLDTKENKVGSTVISNYDYAVNAIGQRTGVTTSGSAFPNLPTWAWAYDSLGQVTSADSSVSTSDRAYQYDSIGNRKKSADSLTLPSSDNYTSNALNQYTTLQPWGTGVSPVYDFDGNMTLGPLPASPTVNSTLIWDAENRLIEVKNSAGITLEKNVFDSGSRKIATISNGVTTLYLYDAWNCIAEYTGTTLSRTRLWGMDLSGTMQGAGGVGGLLSESQVITSNPITLNSFSPTYDGNGNISEYLASNGSVATHYEYDPFGNTVVNTDTGNQFAYRFSTKPRDVETGLYYYGYRYYDPMTGRWPSRDPIEEMGGVNLYGFTSNTPLDRWDYLGQAWYDDIVDYFQEIPDATRECYGETAGDIILSISIVPYEEVATGDLKQIAAGILLSRIPGAKCGIKAARKAGKPYMQGGNCMQKVEVDVKKGKVSNDDRGQLCPLTGREPNVGGDMCVYTCPDGQRRLRMPDTENNCPIKAIYVKKK